MVRLRLTLAVLFSTGCFVDSLGLPPPVGGSPGDDGGAPPSEGGAGGDASTNGGSGGGMVSAGGVGGMPEGGAPSAQHCPPGEVATDIDGGTLVCAPMAPAATAAIAESCAVFYGWRDNCDAGCTMPPSRVGRVTGDSCVEPPSGDSSCQVHDLGPDLGVQLFGLDLDGNANEGDRFYSAISCSPGAVGSLPCGVGGFVTAYDGNTPACGNLSAAVLDYVRPSCALVRGWSDQCGNCTSEPTKHVASTSLACNPGVGGTCAQVMLGADTVELASFDTDGDVGEDDKLHFGLRCELATSSESVARDACPAGQFVVGLEADGSLLCSDLRRESMSAFRGGCALFAGWRDSCNACTDAPVKWGRVTDGTCANNAAADDTCSTMMLAGQSVNLYGLNLDGGVNGDDKFHIGFRCE